ncbi:hypothetical protein Cni_G22957 [Canna indica]|uniref:Uncharacterized protein n=1 Tax=Canna indica TaxID=4628 RepID=A0AAQ3KYU1_9LILI|nr:hypothetical protein Cni_G22957 [Canna indica]
MALPALDGALLALLPLHLLSLGSRFLLGYGGVGRDRPGAARSVVLLATIAVLLTGISALSDTSPSQRGSLVSELEDLRLKTARLELILAESTKTLKSKTLHLEESHKMIKEMEEKIQLLENAIHEMKGSVSDSLNTEEWIHSLEKEVQLLSKQSMKNKDNIQSLQSSANEAKKKMELATSEVEKMESIVTEQWIQIRQLEQAFQLTKMMTSRVLKRSPLKKWHNNRWPSKNTMSKTWFLIIVLIVKNELQDVIKHQLQMNEYTADLAANNLVILFLASSMMAIPILSLWIIITSYFQLL